MKSLVAAASAILLALLGFAAERGPSRVDRTCKECRNEQKLRGDLTLDVIAGPWLTAALPPSAAAAIPPP